MFFKCPMSVCVKTSWLTIMILYNILGQNLFVCYLTLCPLGIFGCFDVRVTSDSDVGSWLNFG